MKTYKIRVYKVTSSYIDVHVLANNDDEALVMAEDLVIDGEDLVIDGNAEPEVFTDEEIDDSEILSCVDSEGNIED